LDAPERAQGLLRRSANFPVEHGHATVAGHQPLQRRYPPAADCTAVRLSRPAPNAAASSGARTNRSAPD
jgi:hypothetical protein